ncbi:unnamed protein product [Staurois parvus]|uniref:Uncharacterized protein n=1 Tax=Staurois parvus TaxID=386267 RepID=A0ABN9BLU8_9NEOB|nr:unnamed protein product [Staurois parvus]
MLSLVCIASELFFFSCESACDQHRANQHYPDRVQGISILLEQNENSSLASALLITDRNEKRYLAVYIY